MKFKSRLPVRVTGPGHGHGSRLAGAAGPPRRPGPAAGGTRAGPGRGLPVRLRVHGRRRGRPIRITIVTDRGSPSRIAASACRTVSDTGTRARAAGPGAAGTGGPPGFTGGPATSLLQPGYPMMITGKLKSSKFRLTSSKLELSFRRLGVGVPQALASSSSAAAAAPTQDSGSYSESEPSSDFK